MQEIFNKYINHLKGEENLSSYTIRNYTSDLLGNEKRGTEKGFFQFLRLKKIGSLKEVDRNILRDYIAWLLEQGVVKASIARKQSSLRSFYRYLVQEKLVSSSPIPIERRGRGRTSSFSIKLDKRLPKFLTIEEMKRFLEAPDLSKPEGQRDRALLELLYASGLRVSELVSLNLEQVNIGSGEIRVRGKGAKERMVLMGKPAAEALRVYLSQGRTKLLGKKRSNAMFLNRYGERIPERRAQRILEKYAGITGINKRVHPHMLRHTFATHLLDGGADLRVVQELLGHANLSSTQIYTHVTKSQARKVYLSAHPLARERDNESEE